ncbi:hypothetical protein C2I36_04985 [Rhodobacteraceae bacterium WD3A24]|nr:hypothetical protein C2I36_04985 [Rhodobacteraceae bacterium WD3A24]
MSPRATPVAVRRPRMWLVAGAALAAAGAALAQQGMEFIPDGGRTLALEIFGDDPERLAELAARDLEAADWREMIAEEAGEDEELDETRIATLASYLAINFPVEAAAELAEMEAEALPDALPRDGKDLAVRHCQSCHGLFSGYLSHDRDATGWTQTFSAPFHQEIPMSDIEIETFANYSELNMPLSIEDVPPAWRF